MPAGTREERGEERAVILKQRHIQVYGTSLPLEQDESSQRRSVSRSFLHGQQGTYESNQRSELSKTRFVSFSHQKQIICISDGCGYVGQVTAVPK